MMFLFQRWLEIRVLAERVCLRFHSSRVEDTAFNIGCIVQGTALVAETQKRSETWSLFSGTLETTKEQQGGIKGPVWIPRKELRIIPQKPSLRSRRGISGIDEWQVRKVVLGRKSCWPTPDVYLVETFVSLTLTLWLMF